MRPLALFGAVVLMLVAAYGLSPTLSTGDYCGVDRLERAWWPPGVHCRYMPSYERGSGPAEPDTANAFAFIATLVIGVAFVLARRSRLRVR